MVSKNVLIAPLNWGLGHASRCVPIIKQQLTENNNVIIASDGESLSFLRKEFPNLEYEILPSYTINYPTNKNLIWHLLKMSSRILKTIDKENKVLDTLVDKYNLDLIISDNRFGMYHKGVFSVYITHQTNIQAGKFSRIANKVHNYYMKRFNEVWIPDYSKETNLSLAGELSIYKGGLISKYIGPLSRFKKNDLNKTKGEILVIISGPEPQRTIFEEIINKQVETVKEEVVIVRGVVEGEIKVSKNNNVTTYNYLLSDDIEQKINDSNLVISRSGYSTIMDLYTLGKKAFFVPTPGQTEQEYLAKHLKNIKIANFEKQEKFNLNNAILNSESYTGFINKLAEKK